MKTTIPTADGGEAEIEERELLRFLLVPLCASLADRERHYRSVAKALEALGLPSDGSYSRGFSETADKFAWMLRIFESGRDGIDTFSDEVVSYSLDLLANLFGKLEDLAPKLVNLTAWQIIQMADDYRALGGKPESDAWNDELLIERERDLAVKQALEEKYRIKFIVKPQIHKRKRGRGRIGGYDQAFARIYFTQECNREEAFELYLQEEGIEPHDELDRANRWDSFRAAMDYRLKSENAA